MSDVDSGRTPAADKALAAIAEAERLLEVAQRRALQLIGERGVLDWTLLSEWLDAQGAARGPATEFEERETEYVLRIALPGFDPAELATEPRELVIRSKRERGKRNASVTADPTGHRPAALPPFFRPETAKATLHNGVLTLIARKTGGTVVPPPDGRAAP